MKQFKFENKNHGMRCNVLYVFPLTIVGYLPEQKLVVVQGNFGQYDKHQYYVPEKDIIIEPENI
jgi:hypothetical protein